MNVQEVQYALPFAGYLFPVALLILVLLWSLQRYRQKLLGKFLSGPLCRAPSRSLLIIQAVALSLSWCFAVLALMQPIGQGHYLKTSIGGQQVTTPRQQPHFVILLIDASASMRVADSRNGRTRFDFAKEVADTIVSQLKGQSVAVYAFTSQLTELSPLTTDYLFVRQMIRTLEINEGGSSGTNIGQLFTQLQRQFFSQHSAVAKSVIILSDGEDTFLMGLSSEQRHSARRASLDLVATETRANGRFYTVGMGSEEGGVVPGISFEGKPVHSKMDLKMLQEISEEGKGRYYIANGMTTLTLASDIAKEIDAHTAMQASTAQLSEGEQLVYEHYYRFPLFLAILCLGAVLWSPEVLPRLIKQTSYIMVGFFLISAIPGRMEEAAALYHVGEFSRAVDSYQELLQGSLSPWKRAVVQYNLAMALSGEKKWGESIEMLGAISIEGTVPWLPYRVQSATARALWQQGLELLSVKEKKEAFAAFQESLTQISEAQKSWCQFQIASGITECTPNLDLSALEEQIKKKMAEKEPLEDSREPKKSPSSANSSSLEIPISPKTGADNTVQLLLQMEREDAVPAKKLPTDPSEVRPW
jgi:hypothetical protein